MKTIFAIAMFAASATAQLLPLPSDLNAAVGKIDWNIPCSSYVPYVWMTTSPDGYVMTNSYVANSGQAYRAIKLGETIVCRTVQRGVGCQSNVGFGVNNPPFFTFGPRVGGYTSFPTVVDGGYFMSGQNAIFNYTWNMSVYRSIYQGAWDQDPNAEVWAWSIDVPNDPALVGSEWATQSLFVDSGRLRAGNSHYVKIATAGV